MAISILRTIWAKELDVQLEYVEDDDNFFEVGGTSISAVQLAAAAQTAGIDLTVTDIYQHPQWAELVAVIDGRSCCSPLKPAPDVLPFELVSPQKVERIREKIAKRLRVPAADIEDIYPCSPLQEALMMLSMKEKGSYLSQFVFRLPSTVDIPRLRRAWNKIVEASDVLRSRLVYLAEGCFQVVVKSAISWQTANELETYLASDKGSLMLLGHPLVRLAVIHPHAEHQAFLVWTIHHSIHDRWSINLVLNEVNKLSQMDLQKFPDTFPSPPPKFAGFIKHLLTDDQTQMEQFWTSRLAKIRPRQFPPLPSPFYQPRTKDILKRSAPIARRDHSKTTMSTVIQAAWGLTIGRHTGCNDVVFGMTLIGRDTPVSGITHMLGPTIATVPIPMVLNRDQKVATFLKQTQQELAEIIPFEHIGLQRIFELDESTRTACNFQSLLVIQPYMASSAPDGWKQVDISNRDVYPHGLVVECLLSENQSQLKIQLYFDPGLLTQEEVQTIVDDFERAISVLGNIGHEGHVIRDLGLI
ncbi:Nonribosomal peptide synthetase 4 [Penicillium subrubescens]|uniref:Nonribosomal peptide synthetase 4 n=1 Tax=Penicillium subrubescens TaxID=1316194 RepID=A0A1Q5UGN6_9EURO|nr:Nonribosomal peptide synthetase 4 [Penicillium subrubescens]